MTTRDIGTPPPREDSPEAETRRRFGDADLSIRPVRPQDADALRAFFRSHTPETVYQRYFTVKKDLTPEEALRLCTLDYDTRMAFGAFEPGQPERFVAIGRYDLDARTGLVETALVVGETWRRRGIGGFLLDRLIDHARARGHAGITAYLLPTSRGMIAIHRRRGHRMSWDPAMRAFRMEHRFDESA